MKVLISKVDLVNVIAKIQNIVPENPNRSVLNTIFLEAVNEQLILSTKNLTLTMRVLASAKVEKEGTVTLSAKKFFQLISALSSSQVEIYADRPETVHIHAGPSHFKMSCIQNQEYPTIHPLREGISLTWDNALLKEILVRSSLAASRDVEHPIRNGLLIRLCQKTAVFASTDRYRLAIMRADLDLLQEQTGDYILPLKAVEEMTKLLETKDQKSKLTFFPDKICIETDNVTLMAELVQGPYPDFESFVPKQARGEHLTLNREELMSLLSQVSIFSQNKGVRFTFSSGELHLTASDGIEAGKGSMTIKESGPNFEIAFNSDYLIDILRHSKDDVIKLLLTTPQDPGIITDSTKGFFVIMPIRV
jgi:DNA polymerase-3 subunit beta